MISLCLTSPTPEKPPCLPFFPHKQKFLKAFLLIEPKIASKKLSFAIQSGARELQWPEMHEHSRLLMKLRCLEWLATDPFCHQRSKAESTRLDTSARASEADTSTAVSDWNLFSRLKINTVATRHTKNPQIITCVSFLFGPLMQSNRRGKHYECKVSWMQFLNTGYVPWFIKLQLIMKCYKPMHAMIHFIS